MRILDPIFFIGVGAFIYCVLLPYPPLDAGGVAVALLVVCFTAGAILFSTGKREAFSAKYVLLALLPGLLGAVFLLNGALDHSDEIRHQTVVVNTHYRRGRQILVARSWRPGRTTESLYVSDSLWHPQGFFFRGEPLTVGVKSGALGFPWITGISRK
jgi:hypothetical protein